MKVGFSSPNQPMATVAAAGTTSTQVEVTGASGSQPLPNATAQPQPQGQPNTAVSPRLNTHAPAPAITQIPTGSVSVSQSPASPAELISSVQTKPTPSLQTQTQEQQTLSKLVLPPLTFQRGLLPTSPSIAANLVPARVLSSPPLSVTPQADAVKPQGPANNFLTALLSSIATQTSRQATPGALNVGSLPQLLSASSVTHSSAPASPAANRSGRVESSAGQRPAPNTQSTESASRVIGLSLRGGPGNLVTSLASTMAVGESSSAGNRLSAQAARAGSANATPGNFIPGTLLPPLPNSAAKTEALRGPMGLLSLNQPSHMLSGNGDNTQGKTGGRMLSPEGVNMMPRPNTVYVEGAAAGVRIEPEQARLLGLRAGETINAVVTQRSDGNVLLVGNQQIPIPERMNLPQGQLSLLMRVMSGQPVLALTDPSLAAKVAAANQRAEADGRFARLLSHVGTFHLSQLFSPGRLPMMAEQSASPELRNSLAALLLDSRQLNSISLRQIFQNTGLFTEHQATLNPAQAAPGLKSMLMALRALMQSRQMDTTAISGAIDEIEARQLDSLAQQTTGRSHYAWMIPFSDQYPVFIQLQHHESAKEGDAPSQDSWSVDLEVGLSANVSMAANVRVGNEGSLALRLWLPDPTFYRAANEGRDQLESLLAGAGLALAGLSIYPVARDAGSVNDGQQRVGVSIDA